jgi:hypothetical protein
MIKANLTGSSTLLAVFHLNCGFLIIQKIKMSASFRLILFNKLKTST